MTQFARWLEDAEAAGLPEPTAMVLATVGERPHARTVLLKAHGVNGFTFYTNRTSRKGADLATDPRCCAVFPWYGLGRQVTVEGSVRPLSMAESEPYYHSRPHGVPDRRVGVAAVEGAGVARGARRTLRRAVAALARGYSGADA